MAYKKKNKRGNVQDIIQLPVVLFVIFLMMFLGYFFYNRIQPGISASLTNPTSQSIIANGAVATSGFNVGAVTLFIGFILVILISAYFIYAHPVYAIPAIFVLAVVVFLAIIISQVHRSIFIDSDTFGVERESFESSFWIINKMPFLIVVVGVIVFIVLWAKPPSGGGQL